MNRNAVKTFVANMNTPSFITDENGNIIYSNNSMRYISEKTGTQDIKHVDEIAIVLDEELGEGVTKIHIEGTKMDGFKYVIKNEEGSKNYIYTLDKSAATDRMVDKLMEHIDEIVVVFNKDGTIERMNSICDNILPFKRKDVIGKNIINLVDEGIVENPIIVKLIETKQKVHKDIVYPNGKIISYTAIPIFGSAGNFRGGVLTGRDISRIIRLVRGDENVDVETNEYISVSKDMEEVKNIISQVAPSDASIFIIGESGVGKEVLTRTIWKQSDRRDKPFVAINCAAIPSELIESELFGYEKGAFTGASKEGKMGLLESADEGTVFLDEIGELPLETQKKLLRVIQEGSITRIGGLKSKKIDLRFISATNKTIYELQDPKVFRQDLFYRLNVIPISVPPLRQRKEDIIPLCNHYVDVFNRKYKRNIVFKQSAIDELVHYNWPGNIRELKNVLERIVILSKKDEVTEKNVIRVLNWGEINQGFEYSFKDDSNENNHAKIFVDKNIIVNDIMNINEAHRIVEQEILKKAVERYGNITEAARAVGINPSTVYRKIKSGQIEL